MYRFILPLPLFLAVSLVALSQVPVPIFMGDGQVRLIDEVFVDEQESQTVVPDASQIALTGDTITDAQKLTEAGLPKDAYDLLRPWLLDSANGNDAKYPEGLQIAVQALQQLNRMAEIDELLESAVEAQKASWRGITSIAEQYRSIPSYGFIIDNQFQRGNSRGARAQYVQTAERDRVRSLQLLQEVMPLVLEESAQHVSRVACDATARYYQTLANGLMQQQGGWGWKLQILTDLDALPDYTDGRFYGGGSSGAPVDAEGNPIYYYVPESWETAENDGGRWRWALEQAAKADPVQQKSVWSLQAGFYQSQFGEQTLSGFNFWQRTEQDTDTTASILNLETLTDDETIAKLATGIKRFELPEEFNYIKLYQKIDDDTALLQLAEIAKNRRQYVKAAEYCTAALEKSDTDWLREQIQQARAQIIGNWGRFEQAGSEVAGLRADLRYIFRNGTKVKLSVQEINVEQLIADIKEYLKSRPNQLDWQRIQIDQIGQQLFYGDDEQREAQQKYIGKTLKTWEVALQPAEKHFDRSTTITFEHETAGAFLIRAEMEDGNVESAVIWLHDTAIVQKNLDRASLYFVADAATGQPIAGANVDLFGYRNRTEYRAVPAANDRQRQENTLTWTFQETAQKTDESGFALFAGDNQSGSFNSLITVTVPEKKGVAHLGFQNLWANPLYDREYNAVKTFVMSDRPVYRPLDTVNIKAWVGTAKYDQPNSNEWAERAVKYEIYNPRREKIAEKETVLDQYGGMTAELELPKDAMLGQYQVRVFRGNTFATVSGSGNFRVEEYKKPEYEVTIDAPKEPVSLGEEITATIRANYYFGSPVAEATVKYTVKREKAATDWYPIRPWDWFYGSGYSWFAYDAEWLPGWARWGIRRPTPPWFPRYSGPPEIVAEAEVPIKPDGTVDVVIDTAIAKEMFPNDSQRYTITAEVVDNSRRTIVGTGSVLVAKEPYKIYAWVNRGFYVPEQKIAASFQTRRLDGKPVSGEGVVKVFRVTYSLAAPPADRGAAGFASETANTVNVVETEVHSATVTFDANGKASLDLTAAAPGQYRISCVIDEQEGGYVFNVYSDANRARSGSSGEAVNAASTDAGSVNSWKYNALELIPDSEEFAPGESVTLRVNTNRENSTVLLFVRPANGVAAGKPQVLRLEGKSTEVSIPVVMRDMPNFFVEALTVTDGKVVNEVKEIVVPPQQRILNVEVRPNAETYKPGGKATADLIVTDLDGKPVVGQIAVTIYDKSVEYISGGSNVGDIKEFFWKWRRNHRPQSMTNLNRFWQRFTEPDKPGMDTLGIFGHIGIPEMAMGEMDGAVYANGIVRGNGVMGGGPGGAMPVARSAMAPAPGGAPAQVMAEMAPAAMPMVTVGLAAPSMERSEDGFAGETANFVEPTVRTNFADTALWIGALETNEEGVAQIELDMPESLTTWKINVWTMALGTRVGHGTAEVITRKDFIIRMQTPRFLIEKDKVVFSANVHNYLAEEKTAEVSLDIKSRKCNEMELAGGADDVLTFRILASTAYPQDEEIIRRGNAEPGRNVLDANGRVAARWIPIFDSQKESVRKEDMVLREREDRLEALVKFDDGVNFTSEYMDHVIRGMGRSDAPGIMLQFNAVGADKLIRLTRANLPDPAQERHGRHLGVVINGQICIAPVIRAVIGNTAFIAFAPGRTEEDQQKLNRDIDDLIRILQAGIVPAELKKEDIEKTLVSLIDESTRTQTVKISANGEVRVDWLVEAKTAGDAVITMKALTDEESDAMQKILPVYVHGMLKQDSYSAFIAPTETSASFDIRVPEERKPEQTKLTVQFSPSLASSMIDALPYLVDYPYGCTEQTLNRFLPTVIVRKVIGDGWDLENVNREDVNRARSGSSGETVNAGAATPGSVNDWAIARSRSPVFDTEQIDEMVRNGVTRLVNMQCSDGGWGWFSGWGERSSPHLTALVVRGVMLAKECDVAVPENVLRRGGDWLKRYQDSQIVLLKNAAIPDRREKGLRWKEQADETDAFVFMVLAELAAPPAERGGGERVAGDTANTIDAPTADMLEFLQRDRGKLSLYAVAMVGIAESLLPGEQDVTPYVKILEQYLVQDEANQTAYLNLRGYAGWRWWAWYGSEFETQAYYLRLLMRADPKSPIAPRLVKYLLNNRKHATYWNSTRDTAIVIEAFAEYLNATGEGKPNMVVEVLVNGEVKKTVEFTPENFLLVDSALVLEADEIVTGTHKVEVKVNRARSGRSGEAVNTASSDAGSVNPLYITAFLENFTLEDPIEKAGLEVNIERRIYKLVRDESATATVAGSRGQAVDLHVEKYVRELVNESRERSNAQRPDPVTALRSVPGFQSGDLIEIELIIESRNDYESLIIEDWKAAGLEPVDLRSGYNGNELGAFVEFRDERVVFFVYRLARGKHSLTYRLRAEIPGEFSALPARIEAMYAPELKGNSDEDKVKVEEW